MKQEQEVLTRLRIQIAKHFNLDELHDLCFRLGVAYYELHHGSKQHLIINLIHDLYRRKRLRELAEVCHELRLF